MHEQFLLEQRHQEVNHKQNSEDPNDNGHSGVGSQSADVLGIRLVLHRTSVEAGGLVEF